MVLSPIYSVSEITHLIRTTLENTFPVITCEGEISNFRPSSTGHYYFSLKDSAAVIQAAMFKNRLGSLCFTPADGMLVKATGSLSVYPKRGTYQLVCEHIEQSGQGNLLLRLEELKKKLQQEGLFDLARKKPLPLFPRRVGVITSPTGAAIQDILRVLKRRNAGLNLIILPAPVQGQEAAARLAEQIRVANLHDLADVLILGRGGGSLEDLLPFYDEDLVRAVAASRIPIISAVGHEIDFALTDFAADLRAETPTAAAEKVTASREELLAKVGVQREFFRQRLEERLLRVKSALLHFSPASLEHSFSYLLQNCQQELDRLRESVARQISQIMTAAAHRLELGSKLLLANSPTDILKRGYSIVFHNDRVVSDAAMVDPGDTINIKLYKGRLTAAVVENDQNEEL